MKTKSANLLAKGYELIDDKHVCLPSIKLQRG